ncbi:MAG TPA: type 1 glutamine amidotransferase domain-containing protein [Solirubrobacteraceae bacterium]|nr:type 1 glutamine amidotransferase domain-containing protein [Solirubrobacteraceae bacterium]
MADKKLEGKTIAILATDGVEQVELTEPRKALEEAGATTHLVSLDTGEIQAFNHLDHGDKLKVDKKVSDVSAGDYDGLLIPGGVANGDFLRADQDALTFTAAFAEAKKPIASICHGPWVLVETGIVKGRTITSWPSLKTDVENAGGTWVDEEVHVDSGLTTSRNPDDIPAFNAKIIEEFCEGKHDDLPQPEGRFARENAPTGA